MDDEHLRRLLAERRRKAAVRERRGVERLARGVLDRDAPDHRVIPRRSGRRLRGDAVIEEGEVTRLHGERRERRGRVRLRRGLGSVRDRLVQQIRDLPAPRE